MTCEEIIKKNMGLSRCNKLPQKPTGMITTPDNFVIPAATLANQALLFAFLNEAILSEVGVYYWPDFKGFENITKAPAYEDNTYAYLKVDDGQYRFRFMIQENLCIHKAMYTHRAVSGRVLLIDADNQLFLTETNSGDGAGFRLQLLTTEPFVINDGAVSTKSPVVIALKSTKEVDKTGLLFTLDSVNELYRPIDLALQLGTIAGNSIVVTVIAECDGTPIEGLQLADFVLKTAAGAAQIINSYTDNGDGNYTLTKTSGSWVDGTLSLLRPDELSITPYAAEVVEIDIPS